MGNGLSDTFNTITDALAGNASQDTASDVKELPETELIGHPSRSENSIECKSDEMVLTKRETRDVGMLEELGALLTGAEVKYYDEKQECVPRVNGSAYHQSPEQDTGPSR